MSGDPYCPRCGGALEHDAVDIGVGTMYGPAFCVDCGWSEDSGDPAQNLFDDPEITDESDTGSHRNNRTRAKEG